MKGSLAAWQVWWADFNLRVEREQAGLRPAVVVSTAFDCAPPIGLTVVVPRTTTDRGLPYQPRLTSLNQPTFAMFDHVKSVSEQRLTAEEIYSIKFTLRGLVDFQ